MPAQAFQRIPWITAELRRIAQARFPSPYWASIDEALLNCLESHSMVQIAPTDDKQIAAFVLVCPPTTASKAAYGIEACLPSTALEIAFVATDTCWEGRGYARDLMESVLSQCKTLRQSAWLHVDTINEKARAFYERLGFHNFLQIPDPFGAPGTIMVHIPSPWSPLWSPSWSPPRRHEESLRRPTLLNPAPRETEQALSRSILPPPRLTCC